MTFVNDNNEVLDVEGDLVLTKQAVSFFKFTINGDYSVNFTVPKNSETCNVLGYYGPQMNQQVAFTKQSFNAIDNQGNYLTRGSIVIQDDDGVSLNCFFVSGNSNWIGLLDASITSLDWNDYTETFQDSSVNKTRTTGIIYPIVDWGYNLKKGSNYYHLMLRQFHIADSNAIFNRNQTPTNRYFFDLYPCVYLSTVVQETLRQNGLKLSGNLISDQIYNSIIITPDSGQMTRPPVPDVSLIGSAQAIPPGVGTIDYKYTSFTTLSDPEATFSGNKYTAPRKCGVRAVITIKLAQATPYPVIGIYKNGGLYGSASNPPWIIIDTSPERHLVTGESSNTGPIYSEIIPMNQGDTLEIYFLDKIAGYIANINMKIIVDAVIMPGDVVSPGNFLPNMKGLDLIKFVVQYPGCVVYYDEVNKTISANIIDNIKKEDAYDWSEYYLSHRSEYTVEQAKNNYIRFKANDEPNVSSYNSGKTIGFGEGNIETGNNLKTVNELFTVPFQASFFGQSLNGTWNPVCPLFDLSDSGDPIPFTASANDAPTSGGAEVFYINAVAQLGYTGVTGPCEIFRIVSIEAGELGYFVSFGNDGSPSSKIYFYGSIPASYTGTLYRQAISYKSGASRLLIVNPNRTLTDFSDVSTIKVTSGNYYTGGGTVNVATSYSAAPVSWFSKPKTNKSIDAQRLTLGIDNPQIAGWTSQHTIKETKFNKISNILNNPTIRAQMLLPKSVYQSFDFSQFIYLKTKGLTGYFFVDSIVNYRDSKTQVEVNLYIA